MAKLKIITDQEFLRKQSKPVTEFGERLNQLLDDMHETMLAENGIGLAAPQVGVLSRVCIVADLELVNPTITNIKGGKKGEEACLSIPDTPVMVKRPRSIVVRAFDRDGKEFTIPLKGLLAVVACHEIDHLDGVLITDKCEA